jgi:hypothetical protein
VLAAVADGASTASEAFMRIGAREPRPFLGDHFAFRIMTRLATARTPLLEASAPRIEASTRLAVTAAGQGALEGHEDHVRLNGIDRWIGGVHLAGDRARWRWHEGREAIVAAPSDPPASGP